MPIRYSTNWKYPMNTDWIAEHGSQWAVGRIDIYGSVIAPLSSLPPMHNEDWISFSDWLCTVETDAVWTIKQLIEQYQKTNPKILWLYDEPK